MKRGLSIHKLHKISFLLLLLVIILDPGNQILGIKELLFVMAFLICFFSSKKYFYVLVVSILFSFFFPLIWVFLGYLFDYNFSLEYAMMYLKAFTFFMFINVILDVRVDFHKLFALSTLVIIIAVLFVYVIVRWGSPSIVMRLLLYNGNAFSISRRVYNTFEIAPSIFYKTSPLLIFGLSYLCQQNRFKYPLVNLIIIFFCLFTLVISSTRANILSAFSIVFVFFYINFVSRHKIIKFVFFTLSLVGFTFFIFPFLIKYFFDRNELSNRVKLGLINDYFYLWTNDICSFLLGQGLGGGFQTSEGGLSYLAEPTYFEIIRMFGLIGGSILILFIMVPLYLFVISKSSVLFKKNYYMFLAYILYVLIEIPSNPLLLGSTGMLVVVMMYSLAIKVYFSRDKNTIKNAVI